MFCWKCGAENEESARFCLRCGARLAGPEGNWWDDHRVRLALVTLAAVIVISAVTIVGWAVLRPVPTLTPEPASGSLTAPAPAIATTSDGSAPEDTPSAPTPASPPADELGTSNLYLEYILDASGSMNEALPDGSIKLEVARELLSEHLQAFLPETNIGLRAYGHRVDSRQAAESCQDIQLVAPVGQGQLETIVTWLSRFQAQGMTPLAESIRLAVDDFVFEPGRINAIVMISDGEETCEGDPCGLVEELKAQGINFTIHVVGLDVDEATRKQLLCIADAAGGTYHDARSATELEGALDGIRQEVTRGEATGSSGTDTPVPVLFAETPVPSPPTDTPTVVSRTETATPSPAPVPIRIPSSIAFFSDVDSPGSGEIYVMHPDGSGQTRLTSNLQVYPVMPEHPPDVSGFGWSAVANQFIYDAFAKMYAVDPTRGAQQVLAERVQYSALSPDGRRIAFVDMPVGDSGLLPAQVSVMSVDGTGRAQLTQNGDTTTWFFYPTWSPDGQRIAYQCATSGMAELCVVDAGGGVPELLIPSGTVSRLEACRWSPDGRYVACDTLESTPSIYLVELETNRVTRLVSGATWPAWSPDSSQIAFQRESEWQIGIINVDGSDARQLTSSGRNCCPTWLSLP